MLVLLYHFLGTKKKASAWLTLLVVGLDYFFRSAIFAFGFFLFHFVASALYCFTKAARSAIALASAVALSALSVATSAFRLSKIPCIAVICATSAARVAFVLEEEFDTFAVADTAT